VCEALLQTLGLEERKTWEACVDKLEFKPDKKALVHAFIYCTVESPYSDKHSASPLAVLGRG
jgi:hypothetical protein